MAMGDDGGGSVRVPSAFCGLIGLHPTRGRIPHVDYQSAAPRLTVTVGPMVRHVRDAAIAMSVLAGPDGRDFVCLPDEPPDYLGGLEQGIEAVRFAWTEDFGFSVIPDALKSPQFDAQIHRATGFLRKAGGKVTQSSTKWEHPMNAWLAAQQLSKGANVPSFYGKPVSESELIAAVQSRQRNWQRFRDEFKEVDFIVSPTVRFVAPKIDRWIELVDRETEARMQKVALGYYSAHTMMCNVLGLPAITLPAGFVDGMPIGLQVIGKPNSEARLLQVAHAFFSSSTL